MTDDTDCWAQIISEMSVRHQKGLLQYDKPVTPDCLHDWLAEAESELLDGAVYLRAGRLFVDKLRFRLTELEEALVAEKDFSRTLAEAVLTDVAKAKVLATKVAMAVPFGGE